jgi:hypothetical protein
LAATGGLSGSSLVRFGFASTSFGLFPAIPGGLAFLGFGFSWPNRIIPGLKSWSMFTGIFYYPGLKSGAYPSNRASSKIWAFDYRFELSPSKSSEYLPRIEILGYLYGNFI